MGLFDTVVIGSGVAGMTAAIYLKRSNKKVLLLEKSAPGGQINRTAKIENYPGYKEVDGPTLAMNIYEQVMALEIEYRYGNVLEIENSKDKKIIKTDMEEIETKTIVIASGRSPKELGLDNEKQLIGHGISYCAICDGPLYKEQVIAVVGGGNSALEEALYLSELCKKVYIIHRRDTLRADAILQEKTKEKKNIEFLYNSNVTELQEENNQLTSLLVNQDGKIEKLDVNGLFIYIGNTPNTEFLKENEIQLENGYLVVDSNMKTSIDGIYACGDVIKKEFYQISTAVGEGATAALAIKKALE